jgi:HPr kinase/phosphorylase
VYGIGMLITGKSGIGKSEVALDLVERGQRMVADDTVRISKISESILMARGHDRLKHFMEIRGVGIVDVSEMFGIRAVRLQKRLEAQVDLQLWDGKEEYERLGISDQTNTILGIKIPLVKLPVVPGKNITVIVETIALNLLLKAYGYNAAQEFQIRLAQEIQRKSAKGKPFTYFIDQDFE